MFSSKSRLTGLAGGAALGLLACAASTNVLAAQPGAVTQQAAAPEAAAPVSTVTSQDIQNLPQRLENLERTVKQLNEITNAQQAAPGPKIKMGDGGIVFETEDKMFSFQPFGRFHFDGNWFDQDKSSLGDGLQVRRARLGMTGTMFGDWGYKVEYDFGGTTTTAGLKEAWIKYAGVPQTEFLVGNVPVPFGLEMYTSDNFITFIERALPSPVYAPERLLGFVGGHYEPNWSFASGIYGKSVDAAHGTNEPDDRTVFTARGTFDPISEPTKLIHFGLGFLWENPNSETVAFSSKPEATVTNAKFVNTGTIANTDHLYMINPELALIYGPASLQGEYFFVPITRTQPSGTTTSPSVDLTGWYAQASYFLTGESRNYNPKSAKFDRVKPMHNLGKDGFGAFELAARVSNLDFDDGASFQHGTETNYTFGLNWYVNPRIRFMANYILVRNNSSANGNAANLLPGFTNDSYDNPSILEFRAAVDF